MIAAIEDVHLMSSGPFGVAVLHPAERPSRAKRGDRDYRMPTNAFFFFVFFCTRSAPLCMLCRIR